jgi:lysophospholipase L1-like esterase
MRGRRITIAAVAFALALGSGAMTISSAAPTGGTIYLSLGDSLGASVQPTGETRSGYAEQLYQLEQPTIPDLRLTKLACPGERTSTMDESRRLCPYEAGSQLDQAVEVLQGGDVAFVTLQIGSNDTFHCFDFRANAFDPTCVDAVLPAMSARLTTIVQALRAADPDVPIIGGTYPDPLLALWTVGVAEAKVRAIADVWTSMNAALEQTYTDLGVPVADIEGAFSSADFDTMVHARGGELPLNVARVCQWMYTCSRAFDHDFHPNTIGYAVMARAYEDALDGL